MRGACWSKDCYSESAKLVRRGFGTYRLLLNTILSCDHDALVLEVVGKGNHMLLSIADRSTCCREAFSSESRTRAFKGLTLQV